MAGRLSTNLTHEGKRLVEGDIIQLTCFTPLTFTPKGQGSSQRLPSVAVHTYSKVEYASLPDKLNSPKHCVKMTSKEMKDYNTNSAKDAVGPLSEGLFVLGSAR